jgi:hypothetical protein
VCDSTTMGTSGITLTMCVCVQVCVCTFITKSMNVCKCAYPRVYQDNNLTLTLTPTLIHAYTFTHIHTHTHPAVHVGVDVNGETIRVQAALDDIAMVYKLIHCLPTMRHGDVVLRLVTRESVCERVYVVTCLYCESVLW